MRLMIGIGLRASLNPAPAWGAENFPVNVQKEENMPFVASNGLTEAATSKTIAAGGMTVHYHDLGAGEPVLFLHSYGPGTTAWITFHKTVGLLAQHFRCVLMDLPNFSKTGPIVYREGQLAGGTVGHGGRHDLPRTGPKIRDGRLAYRHRRRSLPDGQSPVRRQPGHPPGNRRSEPRQYPAIPARAHRRREPGDRRTGGLH